MSTPLHVLIVEDSVDDTRLVVDLLTEGSFAVTWRRVETADALREALASEPWDVVLCDYTLPHFDALAALALLRTIDLDLPFIIVSGTIGEDAAVEAMRSGAQDYVMKDRLARLPAAVKRELHDAAERREHRRVEMDLLESEVRFRRLFESAKDGILVLNARNGAVVDVNPLLLGWVGATREQFVGKRIWELSCLREIVASQAHFVNLRQCGDVHLDEQSLEDAQGRRIDVEFVSTVYPVGNYTVMLCNLRDIRTRRQAQAALHESEERFRGLVETTTDWIWETDEHGIYRYASPHVQTLLGLRPEEAIGRRPFDFMPPDEARRVAALIGPSIARREPFHLVENVNLHRDGHRVVLETSGVPFHDPAGTFRGYRGIDRDITERKQAEAALQESEIRYRALIEGAAEGILVADVADHTLRYANPEFCRMLGYSQSEVLALTVEEIHPPAELDRVRSTFPDAIEKSRVNVPGIACRRKDGSLITVDIQTTVMTLDGRLCSVGFLTDITDRLEAEAAVRRERDMFESLARTVPDQIYFKDRQGRFVRINDATARAFGLPGTAEAVGKTDFDIFTDEHARQARDDEQRIVQTGAPLIDVEEKETWPDGRISWVSTTKIPWRDAAGAIIGVIGISRDITARRAAEASSRLFRTLIDHSSDIIEVVDPETGRIIDANATACAKLGYSRDELLQLRIADVDPEATPALFAARNRQTGGNGGVVFESHHRRKDGHVFPVEVSLSRAQLEREYGVVVVRDITARAESERRLHEQAELLDKTNEAIIVGDLADRITFWNRGAERMLGWTAAEMTGRPLAEALALGGVSQSAEIYATLGRLEDWRGELHGQNRASDPLVLEVSATVLRDEAGKPAGWLAIGTDVTEKNKLHEQFLRAQRLESLGMLAAGIAHDLNNVLAPIGMAAAVLRARTTAPGDLRLLETLDRCADRGAGLVRQILGFAQGVSGEPRLVQLKHLLRDVTHVVTETFPKSITLDENIPADLWPVIGNPTQIHQVLLNLCVNARDAMPQGGTLRVRAENKTLDPAAAQSIDGARPGSWLLIEIGDNGTGIAPEILPKIWDPFFTTKPADQGTGLGLATVRGIVAAHHGFIGLETEPGRGTTFRVYFPAEVSAIAEADATRTAPTRRGGTELILLVDDEEEIRETAKIILTDAGYRVVTARDGSEAAALFQARAAEFAMVITDLDMPRADGESLARLVHAVRADLPVLAMSGVASRGTSAASVAFASAFLQKPFAADGLLNEVQHLLHETVEHH